jgi:hypothetical protein
VGLWAVRAGFFNQDDAGHGCGKNNGQGVHGNSEQKCGNGCDAEIRRGFQGVFPEGERRMYDDGDNDD